MGNRLKRCGCGGSAEVKVGNAFLDRMVYVICRSCHARSELILIDHPRLKANADGMELDEKTRYTEEEATEKAIDSWNRGRTNG